MTKKKYTANQRKSKFSFAHLIMKGVMIVIAVTMILMIVLVPVMAIYRKYQMDNPIEEETTETTVE